MSDRLRDAIAAAPCVRETPWPCDGSWSTQRQHLECAEAAALKWFADWLRSGTAEQLLPLVFTEANTSGTAAPHVVLHALADALTKENP